MCGLVAVINCAGRIDEQDLRAMRCANNVMLARGPDGMGEWCESGGRLAMAHRRLAIIDLSPGGHQPMVVEDGRYAIVFNGEIYNHLGLRKELEVLGQRFISDSDTEVLLRAYMTWGADCLPRLRGMFAFVIWDSFERRLFAARDVFGIKPLYYRQVGSRVWFASQCKALASVAPGLTPCAAGKAGFLLWGAIPEPWTPFREIKVLPAGHTLVLDAHSATNPIMPQPYQSLRDVIASTATNDTGRLGLDTLSIALKDTVAAHMIADVPVGVFLSAGLDSCTLAMHAAESNPSKPIRTVTLGFREYVGTAADEVPLAERVAAMIGSDHQTIWVSRQDFEGEAINLMKAMDMPTQDGVNSYLVSLAARRAGLKVALSGLGGDELFGSYPSFQHVPRWARLPGLFRWPGRFIRRMATQTSLAHRMPKHISALEYAGSMSQAYFLRRSLFLPWELEKYMPKADAQAALEELATYSALGNAINGITHAGLAVSALEASWYMRQQLLRDSDWASMAHSIEVRVPFVDLELWRAVLPLRKRNKPVTKREMADTAKAKLPQDVLTRAKTGFSVPVAEWFRQAMPADAHATRGRGLRPWSLAVYDRWMDGF